MRKYFLVLVTIFALCLFTGIAVAQSQSSTSPNSETQGTLHNGQATNPGDANASTQSPDAASQSSSSSVSSAPSSSSSTGVQNDQSTSTSSTSSSTPSAATSSSDMASASSKTLEGCLVKENTDYFIQPMSGEREKLNSTEDLSSKVNKQVRVEGIEQPSMASNSASSSPSGSASTSTSANSSAGTGSAETQNNAAGSIAGNAGSSNATGTGASASSASSNAKEFQVTKIETVSESCPAASSK